MSILNAAIKTFDIILNKTLPQFQRSMPTEHK